MTQEVARIVVELRDGDPVSELSQTAETATSGAGVEGVVWSLLPLRVRGIDRVRLHADLTILAKLATALSRAQVVPVAA